MAWLILMMALACLVLVFFTGSIVLGVGCMLMSLALLLTGMLMLLSSGRAGAGERRRRDR